MSVKLTELQTLDGSKIYLEYGDEESYELQAVGHFEALTDVIQRTEKYKQTLVSTIQGYSSLVLSAIKDGAAGSLTPDRVALEFGIQLGGELGVPFVTKGMAQANVKVSIEWGK